MGISGVDRAGRNGRQGDASAIHAVGDRGVHPGNSCAHHHGPLWRGDGAQAVAAFQTYAGREATGTVDRETWDEIYAQYQGIRVTVFGDGELFPFSQFPGEAAVPAFARQGGNPARSRYQDSTRFVQYPGMVLSNGMRDQEVNG